MSKQSVITWRDAVSDKPSLFEQVLLALSDGRVVVGFRWSFNGWEWPDECDDEDGTEHVTHWALIPLHPFRR